MDERLQFVRFVRDNGQWAPVARVLMIQPPLADDGETDCWTYAASYAARTGATYVEGICALPPLADKKPRTAVHAWCEEATLFGRRVVEFTAGYEDAFEYFGVPVPLDSLVFEHAVDDDGRRNSVIEFEFVLQKVLTKKGNRR